MSTINSQLSTRRRLPWHKRLLFNAIMLIGVWGLIELASFAFILLKFGSWQRISLTRIAVTKEDPDLPGGAALAAPTMLHPYIGFVQDPAVEKGTGSFLTSDYGFADEGSPIRKRSPDHVIVAIVGGSVARQFSFDATDVLANELSTCPEFAGRTFQFVRLAGNGYKQPQQLMTINYLLSQGAEFDVLINVDGLNETALPRIDNVPFGVNSSYPRDWSRMIAVETRPEYLRVVGHGTYLRYQQLRYALRAGSVPFVYSPASQLIWYSFHDRMYRESVKLHTKARIIEQSKQSRTNTGPKEQFPTEHDLDVRCIEHWQRGSILLDRMCRANGIRYFHFLQPNQYVPNSKPIGADEAGVAITVDHPIRTAVERCFPILRTESRQLLTEAGVAFTDLTGIFADHPEPIYNDSCCHMHKEGNVIMAKAIATHIRKFLKE